MVKSTLGRLKFSLGIYLRPWTFSIEHKTIGVNHKLMYKCTSTARVADERQQRSNGAWKKIESFMKAIVKSARSHSTEPSALRQNSAQENVYGCEWAELCVISVIFVLFFTTRAPNVCFAEWSIWDLCAEYVNDVHHALVDSSGQWMLVQSPLKQFSNDIISLSAVLSTKSLCLVFESLIKAFQCRLCSCLVPHALACLHFYIW